jgi:hypothetical protein
MGDITPVEEALYDIEDYITVPEAAATTGITRVTMITWCQKYKIGSKIGGRWYVDPQKLSLLLRGALKITPKSR